MLVVSPLVTRPRITLNLCLLVWIGSQCGLIEGAARCWQQVKKPSEGGDNPRGYCKVLNVCCPISNVYVLRFSIFYWCVCWRLGNANLESVLANLECLCSVTESDGKVGSSSNGKTLSTYRRFIRNTWPLRNVVNICDACDQCKSLACKHEVNHLTTKVPLPKLQMLDTRTLCVIVGL